MTIVIENARVIPATGTDPIADGIVLVEGDRIAAVGSRDAVRVPAGDEVRVIDAEGGTVLPGLIDCHVHIAGGLTVQERLEGFTPRVVTAHMLRVMARLEEVVRSGITALRDCGFPHHGVFAL